MDEQLLPEHWLNLVSSKFYNTDVQDALDLENRYEDWRLVSMRVTPCGPLGIRLDQDIDDLCWPAVRLVWQPVLEISNCFGEAIQTSTPMTGPFMPSIQCTLAMRMVAADPPTHGMLFKAGWLKEVHHLAFPVTYWTSPECLATPPHCGCSIDSTI